MCQECGNNVIVYRVHFVKRIASPPKEVCELCTKFILQYDQAFNIRRIIAKRLGTNADSSN